MDSSASARGHPPGATGNGAGEVGMGRRNVGTERGRGHREGMRAQRKDDGTEKGCSCGAAVKQSCEKEGRYLISQAKTRECFWPRGRCSVISGAQHWVCRGGTAQANACQEQDRHSPWLGRSRGQPALSGAPRSRRSPTAPAQDEGAKSAASSNSSSHGPRPNECGFSGNPQTFMHASGGASTGT